MTKYCAICISHTDHSTTDHIRQSEEYKHEQCVGLLESICADLGAAAVQMIPSDDKIIRQHVNDALYNAKRLRDLME